MSFLRIRFSNLNLPELTVELWRKSSKTRGLKRLAGLLSRSIVFYLFTRFMKLSSDLDTVNSMNVDSSVD